MQPRVESLFLDVIRHSEREKLVEGVAAAVHHRAGLDLVRKEIEQIVLEYRPRVNVLVGIGNHSEFKPDLDRYRRLGEIARGLFLFGRPDVDLFLPEEITPVEVNPPQLSHDYFCIAAGHDCLLAMLAGELPGTGSGDEHRQARYSALLTFEESIIAHTLTVLERVAGAPVSERIGAARATLAGASSQDGTRRMQTVLANRLAWKLSTMERQISLQALVDPLTGLHNHRYFLTTLIDEVNRFQRSQSHFSVIFIEVLGRFEGAPEVAATLRNEVHRALAGTLRESLRKGGDAAFKLPGNEFAVVLESTGEQDAARVALRIEERFRQDNFPRVELKIAVNGIATNRMAMSFLEGAKRRFRDVT